GTENRTKAILTGSHIDTVINGGKFDGAYGILASLLSAKHLLDTYGRPKTSIEVVSLCEEEGSRFPLTFWGSGNL
ncbi:M20/M25/M40 family metallo-hydrolase, partial [Bacillus licheniformis]|nr:M20/M25/M40 family metallo-hydrolase [Bacillus licheniformis]